MDFELGVVRRFWRLLKKGPFFTFCNRIGRIAFLARPTD